VHVQRVIAISEEKKVETLNRMTDRVHEIHPETGQIPTICADSTAKEEAQNCATDRVSDRLSRKEARLDALSLNNRRCRRSSSSVADHGPEKDRGTLVSVITMRRFGAAHGSVGPLATGPKETEPVTRKRSMRRWALSLHIA
jgi:hypothetical protein